MESEERVTQYSPNQDKGSILEYINPQGDVVNIINNMLGLHISYNKDKTNVLTKRVSKPEFTKEYVMSLATDLNMFLNFTVQVSKFGEEKVRSKMKNYLISLTRDLCTHGDDHYISNDTWQKVKSVHENFVMIDNELASGWNRFGINWTLDKPVDYSMIVYVKDFDEEVDQVIKFRKIISTFSAVIEASFNKSSSSRNNDVGMLLLALGEMRTESSVLREKEQKKKGFLGFGKEEEQKEEWR